MLHWGWQSWSITAAVVVVLAALYRLLTRKFRIWTGWADWCRTAAALSWADRWRLYTATATGRAVSDSRLVPLAVQRAEAAHAMWQAGGSKSRQYWLRLTGVFVAVAALQVLQSEWYGAAMFSPVVLICVYNAVTAGAARRSAEANQFLAERD